MGLQEDRRIEHIIPSEAVKAGSYHCIIEISINAMFGLGLNGFRYQRPDASALVCCTCGADAIDEQIFHLAYCRPGCASLRGPSTQGRLCDIDADRSISGCWSL
jgi:hypothetical protein